MILFKIYKKTKYIRTHRDFDFCYYDLKIYSVRIFDDQRHGYAYSILSYKLKYTLSSLLLFFSDMIRKFKYIFNAGYHLTDTSFKRFKYAVKSYGITDKKKATAYLKITKFKTKNFYFKGYKKN